MAEVWKAGASATALTQRVPVGEVLVLLQPDGAPQPDLLVVNLRQEEAWEETAAGDAGIRKFGGGDGGAETLSIGGAQSFFKRAHRKAPVRVVEHDLDEGRHDGVSGALLRREQEVRTEREGGDMPSISGV